MTTFMLYLFALNLRFAPHPQAGSKSRVICFWSATRLRLMSASETVRDRLTIEIVGFIARLLLSDYLSETRCRHDKSTVASESNVWVPAMVQERAEDIPIYS